MQKGEQKMNTVIQARVDAESKKQAESILEQMGMTLNDAVRMLVKQIIHSRALPFQPHIAYDEPSKELEKILKRTEADIQAGNVRGPFLNAEETIAELEKD